MERRLVFDGVWKRFRRGQVHDSLRDLIPALARRVMRRAPSEELGEREFWALRDVSFEVRPGEVLGIIGGNGAGKSTTLKILNDLMQPTKGRVVADGKIGSLIEVSAGFHQDLTGRQNVFLQGAIMGMRQAEVRRKFDQIVEFAGVSEFIDTPVKRYSSGMNARLGFAIAAHLEPEILIIDEVLAVGDHTFQQRAFGKIKALAQSGIPVVLVSHQMDRIAELSTKDILLERGQVKVAGTSAECIGAYLHPAATPAADAEVLAAGFRFDPIQILGEQTVHSGDWVSLLVTGECLHASYPEGWDFAFRVIESSSATDMHSVHAELRGLTMPVGRPFAYRIDAQMNLYPGSYIAEFYIWDREHNARGPVGPRLFIEVLERNRFGGVAQLNSRWHEINPAAVEGTRAEARVELATSR